MYDLGQETFEICLTHDSEFDVLFINWQILLDGLPSRRIIFLAVFGCKEIPYPGSFIYKLIIISY
jgi:hypothetical protein